MSYNATLILLHYFIFRGAQILFFNIWEKQFLFNVYYKMQTLNKKLKNKNFVKHIYLKYF